jgi:Tol biopolymer transport system component
MPCAIALRIAATAILGCLALAGGLCPKGSPGPSDITETGLLSYITRDDAGGSALFVANIEGSVLSQVGMGLSPPLQPTDGVSLSPGRGRLVFAMPMSSTARNDLYAINRDGSDRTQLTNTADVSETDPDWCRTGDQIAFATDGDIWVMRIDGSNRRNVTNTVDRDEADPSWSPDGLRIAYTLNPNSPNSTVEVLELATGTRTPVAADPSLDDYGPSWSPDGEWIAYTSRSTQGTAETADIHRIHPDGTDDRGVTNAGGDLLCVGPAWSPKSDQLAFRGVRNGQIRADIYLINASGQGLRQFTTSPSTSEVAVDWR